MSGAAGLTWAMAVPTSLGGAPRVWTEDGAVVVEYGGYRWSLGNGRFGPRARSSFERIDDDFLVSLVDVQLPGTSLFFSMRARLTARLGGWTIDIEVPAWGFRGSAGLIGWLAGAEPIAGHGSLGTFEAGAVSVLCPRRTTLSLWAPFRVVLDSSEGNIKVAGLAECSTRQLTLDPDPSFQGTFREALLAVKAPATTLSLMGSLREGASVPLGRNEAVERLEFLPDREVSVRLEAFRGRQRDAGVVLLEGAGTLRAVARASEPDVHTSLRLAQASVLMATTPSRSDIAMSGRLSPTPYTVDVGGAQACIAGADDEIFHAHVRNGRVPQVEVRAQLRELWLPIESGETATLSFESRPLDILLPGADGDIGITTVSTRGLPPVLYAQADAVASDAAQRPRTGSMMVIGENGYVMSGLAGARLRFRRGVDLVNLDFTFEGFEIRVECGRAYLIRPVPRRPADPFPHATVTVHFPPQHIAEQWFCVQDPAACMPEPPPFPDVTRARASGPSRVVFSLDDKRERAQWAKRPLTLASLTEWSDLAMEVNERALPADATFECQMERPQILPGTGLWDALDKIRASLKPPTANQTQLELVGRLLFSPAREARWITPRRLDPRAAPLWHARLDDTGRTSLRAIWSPYLVPGTFTVCPPPPEKLPQVCDEKSDRLLLLDHVAHWRIIAQSSVYGLPAIRRINDATNSTDPVEQALRNMPRSRVIRAAGPDGKDYQMLTDMDIVKGYQQKDSGIAIPAPFVDGDVMLTPIGGIINAEWLGEPPTLFHVDNADHQLPRAVGLEKFAYRMHLGREIRVEVVEKGYLLPLGFRASYVELTERMFFRHPTFGTPYAYPVKRTFIVVQKPVKRLPGVNHPHESRDFPATQIVMRTTVTPDLLPPTPLQTPLDVLPGGAEVGKGGSLTFPWQTSHPSSRDIKIFWPRVAPGLPGTPGDVEFRWTLDDDTNPVTSNLLFVSSEAVGIHELMGEIVDGYRNLHTTRKSEYGALRIARHGGARRRYAPTETDGDTTFDTDSWILSASGTLDRNSGTEREHFLMDGRMEGGDQPPCYPVVETAKINVQSLDRLLGRPQGLITVAFNPNYVATGFERDNPSEIYLNVIRPDIELNVTGQSTTTGGVAQPNALAVALSRKIGVVGGARKPPALANARAGRGALAVLDARNRGRRPTAGARSVTSPYEFGWAEKGKFEPREFLGGLTRAKLLGLIDLQDVLTQVGIEFAPKLVEQVGYGALGAATEDEALRRIRTLLFSPSLGGRSLADRLLAALDQVAEAIKPAIIDDPNNDDRDVYFSDVYPTLHARFAAMHATARKSLDEIKTAGTLVTAGAAVNQIVIVGRPLISEVERTLRDPVPPIVKDVVRAFGSAWTDVKALVNRRFLEIGRKLVDELVAQALMKVCEKIGPPDLRRLLLGTPIDVTCAQIIANPVDALDDVTSAFFDEVLAAPLAAALTRLRGYGAEVTGALAWAEQKIAKTTLAEVVAASERLRDRLEEPLDPETTPDNILARPAREAMRDAITAASRGVLMPLLAGKPDAMKLDEVRAALQKSVDALPAAYVTVADGVRAAIEAQKSAIKAKVQSGTDQVVAEFKQSTVEPVVKAISNDVNSRIAALKQAVDKRLEENRADVIKHVGQTAEDVFRAVASSALYAFAARAGRAVAQWCDDNAVDATGARVIAFADDFFRLLLAEPAAMATELAKLLQLADEIEPPTGTPTDVADKIDEAKRAIKAVLQQLALVVHEVNEARETLRKIRQNEGDALLGACSEAERFLDPAARLARLRGTVLTRIREIVSKLREIEALVRGPRARADLETVIRQMVATAAGLVAGLTSIGGVGVNSAWTAIAKVVKDIADDVGSDGAPFESLRKVPGYVLKLQELVDTLEKEAGRLRTDLAVPNLTTAELATLAEAASAYVKDIEKRLGAHLLQSVTLAADVAEKVGQDAAQALGGLAGHLAKFHTDALAALNVVQNALKQIEKILQILLANNKVIEQFDEAIEAIGVDRQKLADIAGAANDPVTAFTKTLDLLAHWDIEEPALVRTLSALAALAESFLRGDLGDVIARLGIRAALEDILRDLRDAVAQLLPTRVDLGYTWQTRLGEFPQGQYVFKMSDGPSENDLSIRAQVAIDFLTGTRSATIEGTLKPFDVWLVTRDIDIAQLKFKTASFTSVNGSAPRFDAQIDKVVLGTYVEFIKPLQAWLSPSGSGFYLKPTFAPIGLEVGYVYDAGIILVGTLQFINVALGASAFLPFNGDEAEFEFHFASRDRPFLIAAPPYGGGGHVQLLANARSITGFSLSFQFGAVVAIRFGPLRAQGRVTAGVYLAAKNGGRTIAAFIEAVGEGSLACFSICVFLQVGLVQETDTAGRSVLYGYCKYSFSFKVGFVSIKVGFTAYYTIQGDRKAAGDGRRAALGDERPPVEARPLVCATPADADGQARYRTVVPLKASEWRRYRGHLAMDLLS